MGETREEGPELFDLRMSEGAQPLYERVVRFLEEVVAPMQEEYFRLGEGRADPWTFAPGQLEVLDGAKAKAKGADRKSAVKGKSVSVGVDSGGGSIIKQQQIPIISRSIVHDSISQLSHHD